MISLILLGEIQWLRKEPIENVNTHAANSTPLRFLSDNWQLSKILIHGKRSPVMVTLVLYKHKAVKVWSTYFPPNKLRNLDINMASTAHGETKVFFCTTCDMCSVLVFLWSWSSQRMLLLSVIIINKWITFLRLK